MAGEFNPDFENDFGYSGTNHTYPYFRYPMEGMAAGGRDVSYPEIEAYVQQHILDWAKANPDVIDGAIDAEARQKINYVGELMVKAVTVGRHKEFFNNLYNKYVETGKMEFDFSQMGGVIGSYNIGKFFEKGMLGLENLENRAENAPEPDIEDEQIEIKTHGAQEGPLIVDIGGITAIGTSTRYRPSDPKKDQIHEYLADILNNEIAERNIILFKVYRKMYNFLYIRFNANTVTKSRAGKKYTAGSWEFKAMILFLRLLLNRLIKEVNKETSTGLFAIDVSKGEFTKPDKYNEIQWKKNYHVKFRVPTKGLEGDELFAYQIKRIKELYSIRYDYINELKQGTTRLAREFFKKIMEHGRAGSHFAYLQD